MDGKILVPLDGSELAEEILPHVTDLARKLGSEVVLIRAIESRDKAERETRPAGTSPAMYEMGMETAREMVESFRGGAERYLNGVVQRLQSDGVTANIAVVEGAPAPAIVEYARQQNVGMIAMATHARGDLRRLFSGSVADDVLSKVSCPLFLIRAGNRR